MVPVLIRQGDLTPLIASPAGLWSLQSDQLPFVRTHPVSRRGVVNSHQPIPVAAALSCRHPQGQSNQRTHFRARRQATFELFIGLSVLPPRREIWDSRSPFSQPSFLIAIISPFGQNVFSYWCNKGLGIWGKISHRIFTRCSEGKQFIFPVREPWPCGRKFGNKLNTSKLIGLTPGNDPFPFTSPVLMFLINKL